MSLCNFCENEPCLWELHSQCVLTEVESAKEEYAAVNGKQCPNNVCRKNCYRQFSLMVNGTLGKGNRVRLPRCIEDNVRLHYPNEIGKNYLGFKDE